MREPVRSSGSVALVGVETVGEPARSSGSVALVGV